MRRNFSSLYGKTLSDKAQILEFSDYLAIDRTVMANERTLLAYIRTGVGLLIAGLALIRFFKQTHFDYYEIAGITAIVAAISVTILGIRDFFHMRGFYAEVLEQQFLEKETQKAESLHNPKSSPARL
jgi:putative membrane protein